MVRNELNLNSFFRKLVLIKKVGHPNQLKTTYLFSVLPEKGGNKNDKRVIIFWDLVYHHKLFIYRLPIPTIIHHSKFFFNYFNGVIL